MKDKRDYREETAYNAAEEISITWAAGKIGLSKSAFIRMGSLLLVEELRRKEKLAETGFSTED